MTASHEVLALHVLLRQKPLFHNLTEEDFAALSTALGRRVLVPGEVLFNEGDPGDSLFIVGAGAFTVLVGQGTVGQLQPGDVIGEGACIDPAPRSATVRADSRATVFELAQAAVRALLDSAGGAATATALISGIIAQSCARLRDTQQRIDQALLQHPGTPISAVLPRAEQSRPTPGPRLHRGALDLSALQGARSLSDRDLQVLQAVSTAQVYPDGALLCEEGRPGSTCFLVAQGQVEVLRTIDGVPRLQALMLPGSLGGQVALVDHGPRAATLRARGEVVVLPLERQDFEKLLRARSPLALRFQEQVAVAAVRQLRTASGVLSALLKQLAEAPPAQREAHRQKLQVLRTSAGEWDVRPPGGAAARRAPPRA